MCALPILRSTKILLSLVRAGYFYCSRKGRDCDLFSRVMIVNCNHLILVCKIADYTFHEYIKGAA
jgi:hypothetical protein